ncbi:MAG: hypothetical protein ABSA50_08805 [Candidatus Bathyarchaeia archaeon]|jgi:hypothetical protein
MKYVTCALLLFALTLPLQTVVPVKASSCYVDSLRVFFPSTAFANETFTTQTQAHFSCDSAINFQGVQIQIVDAQSSQVLGTGTYLNQFGSFTTYATAPNRSGQWIVGAHISIVGYGTFGETAASQTIILSFDPVTHPIGYNMTQQDNPKGPHCVLPTSCP